MPRFSADDAADLPAPDRGTVVVAPSEESALLDCSTDLVEWLDERYGDALRAVVVYRETVSEYVYLADRVAEAYAAAELERIADEAAFRDALSHPHYESLFRLGETAASATLFEEATLVQVPLDTATGVVLSVDRERGVDVEALVESVRGEHRPCFEE